jgi:hypothetical protein
MDDLRRQGALSLANPPPDGNRWNHRTQVNKGIAGHSGAPRSGEPGIQLSSKNSDSGFGPATAGPRMTAIEMLRAVSDGPWSLIISAGVAADLPASRVLGEADLVAVERADRIVGHVADLA